MKTVPSFFFAVTLSTSWVALAQEAAPTEQTPQEQRISELERRVEVLSQAMEAEKNAAVAQPPPSPGQIGLGPAASKVYGITSGLSIGGYGETIFSAYANNLQDGTDSPQDNLTDTLRAVLYAGYRFNDWLVFDSELEWEHSGISDEHPEGEAVVEFAFLDFLIHPAFKVRAGHLLMPVGFINELHEPPIYLGALRPHLDQEGGLIPTTWNENGIGLWGDLPSTNLSYKLYVTDGLNSNGFNADGNGGIGGGRQDGHLAIANNPALSARLDWRPVPGLLVGSSLYTGNSAQAKGATPIWTTLVEGHAEYRARGIQLRAIYVYLSNSRQGVEALDPAAQSAGVGVRQQGGYVEAGYDVLSLLGTTKQALIPFVRYERFNTQSQVASIAAADLANDQTWIEVGANYKPIPQVAIKTDYTFNRNLALTGRNQFNLALGYLF